MSRKFLRLLHRVTGLCVLVPVVLLVVTGIPLQFADTLGLGREGVSVRWVHDAYNISAPTTASAAHDVVQLGESLLTNRGDFKVNGELAGVLPIADLSLIALSWELILMPADQSVPLERIAMAQAVTRIGLNANQALVIDTPQGRLMSEDLGITWAAMDSGVVRWSSLDTRPARQSEKLRFGALYVTWERWLQDLHSGRFFGDVGVWVMSFAALALVVLGLSGLVVWLLGRPGRK